MTTAPTPEIRKSGVQRARTSRFLVGRRGGSTDARNAHDIERILKTYETALNGNDIETILGLYGDSPVFMPQHAPALVGRDAVRAGFAHVFDTIKLNVRFDVHEIQEAGEWAWARTSSAGRTRILSSGAEVSEGNNELFVFKREKGTWKIHRYLFSTNQPPRR
jgi:uncharacterized protein (TIGR02246 family)